MIASMVVIPGGRRLLQAPTPADDHLGQGGWEIFSAGLRLSAVVS
jgi:hypothetical protein